jgi:multiple sugar transport system substrate-binding protein
VGQIRLGAWQTAPQVLSPRRLALVALAAALAGCAALSAGCSVTPAGASSSASRTSATGPITFATGQVDTGYLRPLIAIWNASHPAQKVTPIYLPDDADDQ